MKEHGVCVGWPAKTVKLVVWASREGLHDIAWQFVVGARVFEITDRVTS